jgi:hypothetical protein
MSDDASPYPLTDSPSGRLGVLSTAPWVLFPTGLIAYGVITFFLPGKPWFIWAQAMAVVTGTLIFWMIVRWWWNTVVWFEWKEEVLRYRLSGRSRIHSLLLPEILNVQPIHRPATVSGFQVHIAGRALRFEYDRAGNALRLRDMLIERLRLR